jgi:hypothetical protein
MAMISDEYCDGKTLEQYLHELTPEVREDEVDRISKLKPHRNHDADTEDICEEDGQ